MSALDILNRVYQNDARLVLENGQLHLEVGEVDLSDSLIEQIRQQKTALIELLKTMSGNDDDLVVKTSRNGSEYTSETSLAQQRMLFLESMSESGGYYNIPLAYRIKGDLNESALERAFLQLVENHEILRTTYQQNENGYSQKIHQSLPDFNLQGIFKVLRCSESEINRILCEDRDRQFDLTRDWPIRVKLLRLNESDCVLSINIHHIAADGWSAGVILDELQSAYGFFSNGASEPIETSRYQYTDYVAWQEKWLVSDACSAAKHYWQTLMSDVPEVHSLPLDHARPAQQQHEGKTLRFQLSTQLTQNLKSIAANYETTPFIVFQVLYSSLLSRLSNQSDIVFGTAVANRHPNVFVQSVGLFVNTIPLRYSVESSMSFEQLIDAAKILNASNQKHLGYPFDLLVDDVAPNRSSAYNPLIQTMLVFQEAHANRLELDNVDIEYVNNQQAVSKFDLALHVSFLNGCFTLDWEFQTALFKPESIDRFNQCLKVLIEQLVTNPKALVQAVELEPLPHPCEAIDISTFPQPTNVVNLIDAQAKTHPEAIALKAPDFCLTYAELMQQVGSLSNYLRESYSPGSRIGVCMNRSQQLVIAMLAIMRDGYVYVPIDPNYPETRIANMIEQANVSVILSNQKTLSGTRLEDKFNCLDIDNLRVKEDSQPNPVSVDSAAYIIFTSGSTGLPKGVEVSHRSLFYSLVANQDSLRINHSDIMPTIGSQAFGVSLLEILLPLISGGQVSLVDKHQVTDLDTLIEATDQVTVLHAVPSLMRQWFDQVRTNAQDCYPNLRLLLVGGEPVPDKLLKDLMSWRSDVEVRELYGMTEAAVVSSSYSPSTEQEINHCIGSPNKNARFYLLSDSLKRQPQGVSGEIYIGGPSLANGYINNTSETHKRFFDNPYIAGERIYRTGDVGRLLSNGIIEFLGRSDNQVSLRGVRIELGEIEAIACGVKGIVEAIAHVFELSTGPCLALYYTTNKEATDNITEALKETVKGSLPDYMRPSVYQNLEQLPKNPNGKLDRKLLPTPTFEQSMSHPETETEKRLHALWQAVLPQENISIDANFFEIGGHSLLATKLISRVRTEFDIDIALVKVFQSPTIRECAALIDEQVSLKLLDSLQPNSDVKSDESDELVL